MKEYKAVIYQENLLSSLVSAAPKSIRSNSAISSTATLHKAGRSLPWKKTSAACCCFSCVKPTSSFWKKNVFKLGVYACLGLFVSWVLLLILQLWFSFIDADLFLKITLTMAGLFIIILASLLVISQYFSEKKMKDDGFIN